MTFYEFLVEIKNSDDSYLQRYSNSLLGFIETMDKFPKKNIDRKTVEGSLKGAMDSSFDRFMFDYVWDAYQNRKLFTDFFL